MFKLILLAAIASIFAEAPVTMAPADNAVSGWTRIAGFSICNSDTINTDQEFYNIIDGYASVYITHGWTGSLFAGYQNGTDKLCIEIHNQGVADSAIKVYHAQNPQHMGVPIAGLGDSSLLDTSGIFTNMLFVIKGPYYITVKEQSKSAAMDSAAVGLARVIVSNAGNAIESPIRNFTASPELVIYPQPALSNGVFIEAAAKSGSATVRIYDQSGRLVRIMDATSQKGLCRTQWDLRNMAGQRVSAGKYFVEFRSGNILFKGMTTIVK
jgi:hypothetical protein